MPHVWFVLKLLNPQGGYPISGNDVGDSGQASHELSAFRGLQYDTYVPIGRHGTSFQSAC